MVEQLPRTCTADEFAYRRDWKQYELVDGELVPFHCGARASQVCVHLTTALWNWGGRRLAWIFSSGASYCCFPGHPNTVRRPWASAIRCERLRREEIPSLGHFTLPPDMAAEVVTPWHTYEEVEAKVAGYRAAGVKLVWIISPES